MSDALQWLAEDYALYGYPVLFLGVLLENAAVPVPGETAVLVAGFMSSAAGGGRFQLWLVILLTALAAVLGDNVGYWLGERFARPRLQSGRRFLFLTPQTMKLAEGYFERWGLWTVFLARFIVGLRVIGALAAGTAGMPWGRFFLANAAGAVSWAIAISLLGYFFGSSLDLLHRWLGRGGLVLFGIIALLVGLPILGRHLRHLSGVLLPSLLRARATQGLLLAGLETLFVVLLVTLGQGHHPTPIDREIEAWLEAHPSHLLDAVAVGGSFVGSLPVVGAVTGVMIVLARRQDRPGREIGALAAVLVVSELLGLLVVGLLEQHRLEPVPARSWPFGFAGLVPLRSAAVFGLSAYLASRWKPGSGWAAGLVSSVLVLWAALGVVWTRGQLFSEVLLEGGAGGLLLVAAVWWLQGFEPESATLTTSAA